MNVEINDILLGRDTFREAVFARDAHRCVLCQAPGQDAHHILERRLFSDGGYYLNNGATVCGPCHLDCERTLVSVEAVREAAGISSPVLPEHFYSDQVYDKWGNIVLDNGSRLRGELFFDESVQKVLGQGGVLGCFIDRAKYPRTHHVPFSPGISDDDRVIKDWSGFEGRDIVVTEKMDGENTTLYSHGLHARSVDSANHPARSWVKMFHAGICGDIPEGWRICGENLYAEHSIAYRDLPSFFMGFSIWNERNECLSWDDTLEWFELLNICPPPTLYRGPFDVSALQGLHKPQRGVNESEGWVARICESFSYGAFRRYVAKYVRANHVNESAHWMHGRPIRPNELASDVSAYPVCS